MCTVLLPPGVNPIAVNKYIIINVQNLWKTALLLAVGKTNIKDDIFLMHLDRTNICPWITTGVLVERY
jgi:hypothetical protein